MSSDSEERYVVARVAEALAADERTSELGVEVTVAGGSVHLTGAVPTAQRRDAVAAVAAEVVPDRDVVNDVTVPELPEPAAVEEL